MEYAVTFGDKQIGKAEVIREGLYYHIVCRCKLTGEIMCCLEANCGEHKTDLGILVPENGGFELETRVPVSRVGEGKLIFCVRPRHEPMSERVFIPISPEEPFAYLAKLKEALLEKRDGKLGISLPKDPE